MKDNELIFISDVIVILNEKRQYIFRFNKETKILTPFYSNKKLSPNYIRSINEVLSSMEANFVVDLNSRLIKNEDSSNSKSNKVGKDLKKGYFLHIDPTSNLVTNYIDHTLLSKNQISITNHFLNPVEAGLKINDNSVINPYMTDDERQWEKKLNIHTAGVNFNFAKSALGDSIHYVPISYFDINKIVDYLELTPEDVIVDMGCGKGRFVCFSATCGIKAVYGVELNGKYYEKARENVRNMKGKRCQDIFLSQIDMVDFYSLDATIYFFYGPFPISIMTQVFQNIFRSLKENYRKIRLVFASESDETKIFLLDSGCFRKISNDPFVFLCIDGNLNSHSFF